MIKSLMQIYMQIDCDRICKHLRKLILLCRATSRKEDGTTIYFTVKLQINAVKHCENQLLYQHTVCLLVYHKRAAVLVA